MWQIKPAHVLTTCLLCLLARGISAQPELQLFGEPYFEGSMTFSVTAEESVGELALLGYGLDPLETPVFTGKGFWYIGTLVVVLPLGPIPASGRLELPFEMPPESALLVGLPIPAQAFVEGTLSNPAILRMDTPYLSPAPSQIVASPAPEVGAVFGSAMASADLDDDGHEDLIVSAVREHVSGYAEAGRVYVFWGPDHASSLTLQSDDPAECGFFGAGLATVDLDQDGLEDLVVGETSGNSGTARPGRLHVYWGGAITAVADLVVQSAGMGEEYSQFGGALTSGDFDDDGWPDLAVSVINTMKLGQDQVGSIEVFKGPDFTTIQTVDNPSPAAFDYFGTQLVTADVNGDGIDDLVEASSRDDVGGVFDLGSVHVMLGPGLVPGAPLHSPLPDGANTRFGEHLKAADLDGDGADELVVSELRNRVYVFRGPSLGTWEQIPKPESLNTVPLGSTSFGYELGVMDVNGDGILDVLVGDIFEGVQSCSLPAEGTLFAALGPYHSTLRVLSNDSGACGDGFSMVLLPTVGGLFVSRFSSDLQGVNTGDVVRIDLGGVK